MKESDEWETPQWLFDELDREFDFDIDLCATSNNSKCVRWYADYLTEDWEEWSDSRTRIKSANADLLFIANSAFMNPPYSNPRPFVEKAYKDSQKYGITIVCLLKCDPSTKTWAVFWDYENHKPRYGVEIRFLPKRIKFAHPNYCTTHTASYFRGNELEAIPYCEICHKDCKPGPTFPSVIVIFKGDQYEL